MVIVQPGDVKHRARGKVKNLRAASAKRLSDSRPGDSKPRERGDRSNVPTHQRKIVATMCGEGQVKAPGNG